MIRLTDTLLFGVFLFFMMGCNHQQPGTESWCAQAIRPEFEHYKEVSTKNNWFKVYQVGVGVYAIAEPFNYQEVISYLIIGSERNILFDTGMGMDRISDVIMELARHFRLQ